MPEYFFKKGGSFIYDEVDKVLVDKHTWHCHKGNSTCYPRTNIRTNGKQRPTYFHRFLFTGTVDHINGSGLDNRRINLRQCTSAQNHYNLKIDRRNKTGYKGVYFKKNRHGNNRRPVAAIQVKGKKVHLGYYKTVQEAARAYNEAAIKYFGEFARLNQL